MNINNEIFRRLSPQNKLSLIENATESELLAIKKDTIIRMVKEVGSGYYGNRARCHNKSLRTSSVSNEWNGAFEGVNVYKKELYVDIYLQYSNTDTNTSDTWDNFMKYDEYRGSYTYEDRYGNNQTTYFRYGRSIKAECVKAILLAYVNTKYKDKL